MLVVAPAVGLYGPRRSNQSRRAELPSVEVFGASEEERAAIAGRSSPDPVSGPAENISTAGRGTKQNHRPLISVLCIPPGATEAIATRGPEGILTEMGVAWCYKTTLPLGASRGYPSHTREDVKDTHTLGSTRY